MCTTLLCSGVFAAETPKLVSSEGWLFITLDPGHGGADGGAYNKVDGTEYIERNICTKIGQYLKEELETYRNVRVSMTRTDNNPSPIIPEGEILPRVEFAERNYADLLVSLHLNSTNTPNQKSGAYILTSNGNYNKDVADEGTAVALNILSQLENLGIQNNGLMLRDSEVRPPDKNPNGTVADYYGIVRYGLWRSIPSMIIEHCYINSDSDCRNFLSSDEKLRAIAKADAQGIAGYYGLEKKTEAELAENVACLIDYRTHWAHKDIDNAVESGWISGYPDYTFHPNEAVTRAMFVAMLGRLSGADMTQYSGTSFSDVKETSYYAPNVQWAVEQKIVSGFPDGTFHPDEIITREQMAGIMVRYLASIGFDTTYSGTPGSYTITDMNRIGSWALDDVLFCYETGLLAGRGNYFDPKTGATRAEACSVLTRLIGYNGARIEPITPVTPTESETPEPLDTAEASESTVLPGPAAVPEAEIPAVVPEETDAEPIVPEETVEAVPAA